MSTVRLNKIGTLFVTGILCVAILLAPISTTGEVQKANAQLGFSFGGGINVTDVGQTLVNTIAQLSTAALEQKELVLDGLFYDIAQQALQQMVNDILKFVNSGFDGEPTFITDLGDHLDKIGDTEAEKLIYSDETSSLCEATRLDIQRAAAENFIEKKQGFKKEVECTLDDHGADVEAFLSGDFNAGGWSTWFEAVLNPENTAIGGYIALEVELDERTKNQQDLALAKYIANQGFESQEVCTTVGTGASAKEKCSVTTPGILIKEQASAALQIPMLSLLNADEMNETIGALFGNLANQALTGVNGLLGLGGNASKSSNSFGVSGSVSYLDAIKEEGQANSQLNQNGGSKIDQALATESRVLSLQLAIVKQIDAVTTLFEDTFTPFKNDSCWNLEIPEKLSTTLDDLLVKIPNTIGSVTALQELSKRYEEANSASAQLKVLQDFTAMQQEGRITGQPAAIKYDLLLNSELKKIIETFTKDIQSEKNAC